MALKEIVYLTPIQFNTLVTNGSLTVGGVTYNYSDDNDYRVKYTEPTIPVKGVQINGTDLTPDTNGKVNIPIGDGSTIGAVRVNPTYGIASYGAPNGYIYISKADSADITAKSNQYKPIVPSNLQLATDVGVKGSQNYQSFSCDMADGTTKTLKFYCELV